jgi:hypothetical protein
MMLWGQLHSDPVYKRVAENYVGPLWVSTVWLGLDHGWGDGPPVIFETMVFKTEGADNINWDEDICERYSTEEEALAGHERIVASLQYVIEEVPTII